MEKQMTVTMAELLEQTDESDECDLVRLLFALVAEERQAEAKKRARIQRERTKILIEAGRKALAEKEVGK